MKVGAVRVLALIAAALLAGGVLAACSDDEGSSSSSDVSVGSGELQEVTLMLNWTPNAQHDGIYLAQAEGLYEEAGIDLEIVEPGEEGSDVAVGTGAADLGISQAESLLPAREQGVPVVSVATLFPVNDSSLMLLADEGVESPADLEGLTYGGYGGALETELISRLVECDGGDPEAVEHVEVGNVDYLAGLEQDRFDVVWVFEGWDALRAREVEDVDLTTLPFRDFQDCIPNWYTPIVIAGEDILADDPEVVDAFLAATAEGYQLAADDPAAAADALLAAAPELDEDLVRASAEHHAPLFMEGGGEWGVQDEEVWTEFEQFLREAGLTQDEVDVSAAFTNDHLPSS
jgi:ABC-type nitrate/sulfonate/bicarbonate transport system substrate-binding protein